MKVIPTAIPDVLIFEPTIHGDHRGFFLETWRETSFNEVVPGVRFVQDNHSKSGKGILRGLHYQLSQPQGKLVRVIAGEIYDVPRWCISVVTTMTQAMNTHCSGTTPSSPSPGPWLKRA